MSGYKLDRRVFLAALAAGASALLLPKTAYGDCKYDEKQRLTSCYAGIDNPIELIEGSDSIADNWAACTQMVLNYWGVDVRKQDISSKRFGKAVKWVAGDSRRHRWLAERLSNGLLPKHPEVNIQAHSYDRLEAIIFYDLTHNNPLIIGNDEDVMVLTDVYYTKEHHYPQIRSAMVADPRPGNGKRDLCAVRMVQSSRRDWRWDKHDYFWRNIAYVVRITVNPDMRSKAAEMLVNSAKAR